MKIGIIFYSYSGITRSIAEKIQKECGGDLIEVKLKENYSAITAYTVGCLRARRELGDPVTPEHIDISGYDIMVIGTPVWAWKPAPAINGAITALTGGEGKSAFIFATCGSQAGDTLAVLTKALAGRNISVSGEYCFTRTETRDEKKIGKMIATIKSQAVK
jgi:flavodoxin